MKKKPMLVCLLDEIEEKFRRLGKIPGSAFLGETPWKEIVDVQNQILPLLRVLSKFSGVKVTKCLLKRLQRIAKDNAEWSAASAHLKHFIHYLDDGKEA
jgi:hypothetical protein